MILAAFVHTFPATKHMTAFLTQPSWSEGWKAWGSVFAIVAYLQTPDRIARLVFRCWQHHRGVLVVAGWLLALVHSVPAADHLPRLLAAPNWGDAWRGSGALIATVWFVAPIGMQFSVVRLVRNTFNWQQSSSTFLQLVLARRSDR